MNKYVIDWERYAAISRLAAAEGIVLLRNEKNTLPLKEGQKISLFGRIQFDYYKSGTGSGGMVNTRYVTGILDAVKKSDHIRINEELLHIYEKWVAENPFNKGKGWAGEPWSQIEMPVDDDIVINAAKASDAAVIIIGRTAGEDKDNSATKGSYLLTDEEENLLRIVSHHFEKVVVVLNTGNIMDMKWVEKYKPSAVLYAWQGGQEGGGAVLDVLTGKVNPSGRLTDTIAYDIEDYPSTAYFGDKDANCYVEDIYVGYKYFETAAKEKVMYPFGFGLSYTTFEITLKSFELSAKKEIDKFLDQMRNSVIDIKCEVKNTGTLPGKEVVQVYVSIPQGKLGKPLRTLIGFAKTKELKPGETQIINLKIPLAQLSSYDDSGITGHKSCYVLEEGIYEIFVGNNVRSAISSEQFDLTFLLVTEELTEALSPVTSFNRLKPELKGDGYIMKTEAVPLRTYDLSERIAAKRPASRGYTGDKGYKLGDVADGKVSMEVFLDQLTDNQLCCLMRGEGMSSPKVTPGTGAAFGGVTEELLAYGIPLGCCTDGPSGLRMDCGAIAFSLPNGTALGCTFNTELVGELFDMVGKEMRKNRVDLILGPGINIHRNPLNGRNFEYFSEDPLLTGKMAAVQSKALEKWDVGVTVKHFAANNQEFRRTYIDSVVSERALREIYLKGYEIAVREGGVFSVMTTYGGLNGIWTAGNYDLLNIVLRDEWGFNGLVMTDWWAKINDEGKEAVQTNLSTMVRAQNDLYMVVQDSLTHQDNLAEGLKSGAVTRGELLRNAANTCRVLIRLAVMQRYLERLSADEVEASVKAKLEDGISFDVDYIEAGKETDAVFNVAKINTAAGTTTIFGLAVKDSGTYTVTIRYRADAEQVAQIPFSLIINNEPVKSFVFNGTGNKWVTVQEDFPVQYPFSQYVKLFFAQGGLEIEEFSIKLKK